jgi:hypothetical protein
MILTDGRSAVKVIHAVAAEEDVIFTAEDDVGNTTCTVAVGSIPGAGSTGSDL